MVVVDCRSLIEFCRAFDHHHRHRSPSTTKRSKSPVPFCNHSPSPSAVIDVLLLLLVLTALFVLILPCLSFILRSSSSFLSRAPAAFLLLLPLPLLAAAWQFAVHHSRKCGNPYCKGLRKAVEFDIQLESEECVRYLLPKDVFNVRPLELGEDHKELEDELRKMAPQNGRTVLIFRSRCGCPAGRMEVWAPKKVRRIKK